MPIAWLRLRKTDGWKNRPGGVRRIVLRLDVSRFPEVVEGLRRRP